MQARTEPSALWPNYIATIRYGQRDGNAHPYVGLLYSFISNEQGGYICSGTLLSPTVFLTAAHCVDDPAIALFLVTVQERPLEAPAIEWVMGTAHRHTDYDPDTLRNDIAVIVLSEPIHLDEYGALPEAGFLDTLQTSRGTKDVYFTAVGYGLQDSQNPLARRQTLPWDLARYQGQQQLVTVRNAIVGEQNIALTNAPGTTTGGSGTCSGDSGGPILWLDTNIVVAINSFGIAPFCRAPDYAYRLISRPPARSWSNSSTCREATRGPDWHVRVGGADATAGFRASCRPAERERSTPAVAERGGGKRERSTPAEHDGWADQVQEQTLEQTRRVNALIEEASI